jgi:hypothetical protein
MIRRDKIIFSIFLIVIIALAWGVVTLYFVSNSQSISLNQKQAEVLARYAEDMSTQTQFLVSSFLAYHDLTEMDQNQPNMTYDVLSYLEDRSFTLLGNEADSVRSIIQLDSGTIGPFDDGQGEQYKTFVDTYYNVSETVVYAVNQLDLTTGKVLSEHYSLMYELCHILGADQYNATGNNTQLTGISRAFLSVYVALDSYSIASELIHYQLNLTLLNTELGWALANATQLYQNLVDWHNLNSQ